MSCRSIPCQYTFNDIYNCLWSSGTGHSGGNTSPSLV